MRGHVRKRNSGYCYVLYLGRDETGKKRQKWVSGFRTKRECERALAAALERCHAGTWTDPGKQTVAEYLNRWLEAVAPSLRESTAENYRVILERWIVPRIGNIRLAQLDAARISALYGELRASGRTHDHKGLSARSVRYAHAILRHALSDAVRWDLLTRNPANLVDPPRQEHREPSIWTAENVRTFLESTTADRLGPLWYLMLVTGMRRGEALGLRWSDLDTELLTITVRRARVVVDGWRVTETEPKTQKGRRVIPLDAATVAILVAHHRRQIAERLRAGEAWRDTDHMFTDDLGEPLHPQSITKMFQRTVKAAALPPVSLHALRHTSATLALVAGIHPTVVQRRLGHSDVRLTLDVYTHPVASVDGDAADRMGAIIHPTGA